MGVRDREGRDKVILQQLRLRARGDGGLTSHSSLRLANILLTSASRRIPLKCSSSRKPL